MRSCSSVLPFSASYPLQGKCRQRALLFNRISAALVIQHVQFLRRIDHIQLEMFKQVTIFGKCYQCEHVISVKQDYLDFIIYLYHPQVINVSIWSGGTETITLQMGQKLIPKVSWPVEEFFFLFGHWGKNFHGTVGAPHHRLTVFLLQ